MDIKKVFERFSKSLNKIDHLFDGLVKWYGEKKWYPRKIECPILIKWIIYLSGVIVFIILAFATINKGIDRPVNMKSRDTVENTLFIEEYIHDGTSVVASPSKDIEALETFKENTGLQAHIIIVPYDPGYFDGQILNSDRTYEALASYYTKNIADANHILFGWFFSPDNAYDGYQILMGKSCHEIMDSTALSIFWYHFKNKLNESGSADIAASYSFEILSEEIMEPTFDFLINEDCILAIGVESFLFIFVIPRLLIRFISWRRHKKYDKYINDKNQTEEDK